MSKLAVSAKYKLNYLRNRTKSVEFESGTATYVTKFVLGRKSLNFIFVTTK